MRPSASPVDQLLDRVSDLLKLCTRADETGRHVISTDTVREVFGPRVLHPASAASKIDE